MQDSPSLSPMARDILTQADAVYVSAASMWEIAIKAGVGRLQVECNTLERRLNEAGVIQLPISWSHATQLRKLPLLHRDPFDRMLVAQAMVEPLRLLTHDSVLARYTDLVILA